MMGSVRSFMVLLVLSFQCISSKRVTRVTCVFSQSCVLPCSVSSSSDVIINWSRLTPADDTVHCYHGNRDQLGQQDQNFRGRTSLFLDQISRGNASLLLAGVKVQDEGTYRCNTSRNKLVLIHLRVEAPVSDIRIHQDGNRITCSSEGIYPQPELTWSTEPPSNTALQNRTTVHQTEEKLYDISSSLTISDEDPDLIYSCSITTRRNQRRATLHRLRNFQIAELSWQIMEKILIAVTGLSPVICTVIEEILSRRSKNKAN